MTIMYRLATIDDAEEIQELTWQAYEPIRNLGINFAAATADIELVQKNISNNLCYVLEEDDQILATLSIRMPWGEQPGPYPLPHIWWFAVHPKSSKQGVGSLLLTWVEETVIRDMFKAPAVTLGTTDKHPWLAEMYERKGYIRAGEKDSGRGHTTVFLRKELRVKS
ncbi:GNAT family N-acetyltransferase [Brevibacillus daliensis]|uniref:GNAT family N-acetyltransferase n=1 Tax=Brevibacillus daliensis TaxID=2892995 RepID=UPI001E5EB1CD|nr:GNAT family N-acetyltransferase [Brevibacillus daliensis]